MPFKSTILLILTIVMMGSFTINTDGNLMLARIYFDKAVGDETGARNLMTLTEGKTDKAVLIAYNGVAYALMAKYVWSPYRKLENVNRGLEQLNRAVAVDANDIEIRFLRLSVEENIPDKVKFKKHITDDKTFILQHLKSSHPIYQKIRGYLMVSKSVTLEERKNL